LPCTTILINNASPHPSVLGMYSFILFVIVGFCHPIDAILLQFLL
jgi:hypothetical protein